MAHSICELIPTNVHLHNVVIKLFSFDLEILMPKTWIIFIVHFHCLNFRAKIIYKIVKPKNKTLSFPKTKDDSQNAREIMLKENNIGKKSNFLLTLG
jgi:hypothetical protein